MANTNEAPYTDVGQYFVPGSTKGLKIGALAGAAAITPSQFTSQTEFVQAAMGKTAFIPSSMTSVNLADTGMTLQAFMQGIAGWKIENGLILRLPDGAHDLSQGYNHGAGYLVITGSGPATCTVNIGMSHFGSMMFGTMLHLRQLTIVGTSWTGAGWSGTAPANPAVFATQGGRVLIEDAPIKGTFSGLFATDYGSIYQTGQINFTDVSFPWVAFSFGKIHASSSSNMVNSSAANVGGAAFSLTRGGEILLDGSIVSSADFFGDCRMGSQLTITGSYLHTSTRTLPGANGMWCTDSSNIHVGGDATMICMTPGTNSSMVIPHRSGNIHFQGALTIRGTLTSGIDLQHRGKAYVAGLFTMQGPYSGVVCQTASEFTCNGVPVMLSVPTPYQGAVVNGPRTNGSMGQIWTGV